ncbi:amidohydrolase family protein [Candidatus Bathyarchaeota archaeon]|nr:amidohydrolase family protein [Candidatus Bathyarchaeota archaeon]
MVAREEIRCKGGFVGNDMRFIENFSLYFEDGKILAIDEHVNEVDSDLIAVPAFINGHVHVADSFMKDITFHGDLASIVAPPDGLKHQMLSKVSRKVMQLEIVKTLESMVRSGTILFIDFREGGLDGCMKALQAFHSARHPSMAVMLGRPGKRIGAIRAMIAAAPQLECFRGFNISSPNGWNDQLLEEFRSALKQNPRLILGTHVAETRKNVVKSKDRYKMSDASRLLSVLKDQATRAHLVHCNFLDGGDIDLIRRAGSSVILCPRVASLFGNIDVEHPPYMELVESGITCCLGTDNVMLNVPDMFHELNFTTRLFKMLYPGWEFPPSLILQMATINPARLIGIDRCAGSLEKGKDASFFLLDGSHHRFSNTRNVLASLLLRAGNADIHQVYMHGRRGLG